MATSSTDLAAILAQLQQQSSGDRQQNFFQALGQLGAGLSRAGATSFRPPGDRRDTIGTALAGFGQSLGQGRQNAVRQNLLALQANELLKTNRREKNFQAKKPKIIQGFKAQGLPQVFLDQLDIAGDAKTFNTVVDNFQARTSRENLAKIKSGKKAFSTVGKINADFNAGRMDKKTRDAAIAKATGDSEITKMFIAAFNKDAAKSAEFGFKDDEEARTRILNAGGTSIRTQGLVDLMSSPDLKTGTAIGSDTLQLVQGVAQDFGIDLRSFIKEKFGANADVGDFTKKTQFDRLTRAMVTELAQNFKGSLSNKELDFLRTASAGLRGDLDANIEAIAKIKASEELAGQRAQELREIEERPEFQGKKRAALNRFRASKGKRNETPQLKRRAKEIAAEIRANRKAGRQAAGGGDLPPGDPRTIKLGEIDRELEQIRAERNALNQIQRQQRGPTGPGPDASGSIGRPPLLPNDPNDLGF